MHIAANLDPRNGGHSWVWHDGPARQCNGPRFVTVLANELVFFWVLKGFYPLKRRTAGMSLGRFGTEMIYRELAAIAVFWSPVMSRAATDVINTWDARVISVPALKTMGVDEDLSLTSARLAPRTVAGRGGILGTRRWKLISGTMSLVLKPASLSRVNNDVGKLAAHIFAPLATIVRFKFPGSELLTPGAMSAVLITSNSNSTRRVLGFGSGLTTAYAAARPSSAIALGSQLYQAFNFGKARFTAQIPIKNLHVHYADTETAIV